jgi:hypothetical protein
LCAHRAQLPASSAPFAGAAPACGELDIDDLLRAEPNDPGCDASAGFLAQCAQAVVSGASSELLFPDVAAHLRACPACREDIAGLINAIVIVGDPRPP